MLKHCLGFNVHPNLIYKLMGKITYETLIGSAKECIVKLSDFASIVTEPFKSRYQIVLQFGDESWPFLTNSELVQSIRYELNSRGIIPVIHQSSHLHALTVDYSSSTQRDLALSEKTGSPSLITHPPPYPRNVLEETAKALTNDRLLKSLRRCNISIALENLPSSRMPPLFFGSLDNMVKLLNEIAHRLEKTTRNDLITRYVLCFDYGHFTAQGQCSNYSSQNAEETLSEFISVAAEMIQSVHVHINNGTVDQHVLLGERPTNLEPRVLENFERNLLTILRKLSGKSRIFIVETLNFDEQAMIHCFKILDQTLSV